MLHLSSRPITRKSGRTEWFSVVSIDETVICGRYADTQEEAEEAALRQAERLTSRDGIPAEAFAR